MSIHSYSVCYMHIVFSTYNHQPVLQKDLRKQLSKYLLNYSKSKNIYHKINFVNPEHVHILINLPPVMSVDEAVQLLKGSSSYWINKNKLFGDDKFYWQRGYGCLSVSYSDIDRICRYISNQEAHHKKTSFNEEYDKMMKLYALTAAQMG